MFKTYALEVVGVPGVWAVAGEAEAVVDKVQCLGKTEDAVGEVEEGEVNEEAF